MKCECEPELSTWEKLRCLTQITRQSNLDGEHSVISGEMDLDSAQSILRQSIATTAAVVVHPCLHISCFAEVSSDIPAHFGSHGRGNFHDDAREYPEHTETSISGGSEAGGGAMGGAG